MSVEILPGWEHLRHGGMLLDPTRMGELATHVQKLCPLL